MSNIKEIHRKLKRCKWMNKENLWDVLSKDQRLGNLSTFNFSMHEKLTINV